MSRQFGDKVPEQRTANKFTEENAEELLRWIRENEIGKDEIIETPFGKRQRKFFTFSSSSPFYSVLYCDFSASARSFRPIEDYILSEVLPFYGNTHSSVTVTAEQTTLFVHEARQEIRAMTGAGDNDDVIFCGSGSTAAVELLLHMMDLGNDFVSYRGN